MQRFMRPLVASAVLVATPALADAPLAVTPSGATEAYFNLPVVATSDTLANSCIDFGWTTISSTETMVVCEVPMSVGASILSALAAPRYATPTKEFIRFNIAGASGLSRVQVSGWRETQTAFGQTQRIELGNENYHNTAMGFMAYLGGIYPPGTQFPNHASMNIEYEFVKAPQEGMRVKAVLPDGAFAAAGFMAGDIVSRIAKQRIKNNNDLSDGLHKAIRGQSFEVEFYRNGKLQKANVPVIFRPTAGPLPAAAFNQAPPAPTTTTIVQSEFSVAEELQRLADLRDRGILTPAEFDAEKAKLLAR